MEKQNILLLVEDNPNDEALTLRALKKSKVVNKIVVARDGEEALDVLFGGENGEDRILPILTLLDLKLPKVDGVEVLRQIREHESTRLLPVVVLTSSDEENDIVRCYELGANSYIRKPVDFTRFAEAVDQLGLYWLVLNEPPPTTRKEYEETSARATD